MTPAQIQRQLSVNRSILANLYEFLEEMRANRKQWSDYGRMKNYATEEDCKREAYFYHKESVKLVPKIAAIVELQKSLKKDYQYKLSIQRAENLVLNGWLKPHIDAAKRDAEAKGQAAKEAVQLQIGEFY